MQAQKRPAVVRADDHLAWLVSVLEGGGHLDHVELGQHVVDGVRLASNQSAQYEARNYRLAAGALGSATVEPRGPGELAGLYLELPKTRFVDLQQTHQALCLVRNDALKELVLPQKRLLRGPGCIGPHRQPLALAVGVGIELLLVPTAGGGSANVGV